MKRLRNYRELDEFFQGVDYSDLKTIEGNQHLHGFIAGMLSYYPWWLVLLYKVREFLVFALGLVRHKKPEGMPVMRPEDISFLPGDRNSFFIVQKAEENRYWVARTPEDKHLTAWLGIVVEPLTGGRNRFHVFTTVRYRHWTGPVYFNLIRPFHHLVVWQMMKAGVGESNS
jgi:hypothetical protein